jgi:hypothetical protein
MTSFSVNRPKIVGRLHHDNPKQKKANPRLNRSAPDPDVHIVANSIVSEVVAEGRMRSSARCAVSAPSRARGVADEMPLRLRRQVCVGRREPAGAWLLHARSGSAGLDAVATALVLATSRRFS